MIGIGLFIAWTGLLLYILLFATFKQLMVRNEFALLHLLIAFVFVFLFPLPLLLTRTLQSDISQLSSLFGFLYFVMIIITMGFQTGHLSYASKQTDDKALWEDRNSWMINGMLGDGFEPFTGVIENIWLILLGLAFINDGYNTMGIFILVIGMFIARDLGHLLNQTRQKPKEIKWLKMNPFITNIKTFVVFLTLTLWITLQV